MLQTECGILGNIESLKEILAFCREKFLQHAEIKRFPESPRASEQKNRRGVLNNFFDK